MNNKEKNFVSAVVYINGQSENVETFLETLIDVFENNFEHSEIICVNDSLEDNSMGGVSEKAVLRQIQQVYQ